MNILLIILYTRVGKLILRRKIVKMAQDVMTFTL